MRVKHEAGTVVVSHRYRGTVRLVCNGQSWEPLAEQGCINDTLLTDAVELLMTHYPPHGVRNPRALERRQRADKPTLQDRREKRREKYALSLTFATA